MRKELSAIAVLIAFAGALAAEIDLTQISNDVGFFDAKGGVKESGTGLVMFGVFGGGFAVLLLAIAFVGVVFYKYKYSSKEGGAVKEQDLFNKYNY